VSRAPFSFRGVAAELSRTYAAEGVRGLFRGNGAQILRVCPYSGTQLLSFDVYCALLLGARGGGGSGGDGSGGGGGAHGGAHGGGARGSAASHLGAAERVLAGAAAGATSVAATYPLDLLRARLAVSREAGGAGAGAGAPRGLAALAREMVAAGGVASLYRGLAPTLLGILPYAGISFATFEALKSRARAAAGGAEPSALERVAFGGAAGFAGQASTYPLDIVRRRMQTEGYTPYHAHLAARAPVRADGAGALLRRALLAVRWKEGGAVDTLARVYDAEGVRRGLFKGLSLNVIKGPVAVGVSFTTYDLLKRAAGLDE